jgi:hypothetical protein
VFPNLLLVSPVMEEVRTPPPVRRLAEDPLWWLLDATWSWCWKLLLISLFLDFEIMLRESFMSFFGLFEPFCDVLLIPSRLFREEDR